MKFLFFLLFASLAAFTSCYYDSEEYLYPGIGNNCDTTGISYNSHISALLSTYCLSCHAASAAPSSGGNIVLDSYASTSAQADIIQGTINHSAGFSPMPKGGAKLGSCKLLQVDAWINAGKPEN